MLAKFKAFSLKSLNKIRLMNLNKDLGSICKRSLPRLISTGNGYERMNENKNNGFRRGQQRSSSSAADEVLVELGNASHYLLTGLIGTAIVLERKYDIVKNVTEALNTTFASALVVQAKSGEKAIDEEEFTVLTGLAKQSPAKSDKLKSEPDLRKSCNFIANACESAMPRFVFQSQAKTFFCLFKTF